MIRKPLLANCTIVLKFEFSHFSSLWQQRGRNYRENNNVLEMNFGAGSEFDLKILMKAFF